MADSASDPKVEDVLSSVRRLVSGEIPRRTSRVSHPSGNAGALVLTPAHRVTEKPRPTTAGAPRSLEERIAELEAAVDRTSTEFEPDGSEDQSLHRPDRIVYTRPPRGEGGSDRRLGALRLSQIELIETGPAAEDERAGEGAAVAFRRETSRIEAVGDEVEAPMAEDVAPEPVQRGEVRAFTNPDDVVARIEARIEKGGLAPEPPASVRTLDEPSADESVENLLREDGRAKPSEDFDAALSAAVAASVASAVAEEAGVAASPKDFLDQDEVLAYVEAPVAAPEAQAEDAPETAEADADDADADDTDADADTGEGPATVVPSLDEQAVRALVARLIREELQGELGERITRNVRKLVRREIMRALDSRDLV